MRTTLTMLALLLTGGAAQAQSCATHQRSYSYTPTYAPAVTYGTPTYYAAPKKTYVEQDYYPTLFRFILAYPVANLPSYGAAYAPPPAVAPAAQAPPAPTAKAAGGESQMQQMMAQQTQILEALRKLSDDVKRLDQRVGNLERVRPAPSQAQQAPAPEQGPTPKLEPEILAKFRASNAESCAMCHSRTNAPKHGGGFVYSEDDGTPAKLTATQRESVEYQFEKGLMPRVKGKRAEETKPKPLTRETADAHYAVLVAQRNAERASKQGAE